MKHILVILILIATSQARTQTLFFRYVKHDSQIEGNVKLQQKIDSLFIFLKSHYQDFPFNEIRIGEINYNTPASLVSKGNIFTVKPTVFIRFQKVLGDNLVPIFITNKEERKYPYYNSFIIANKAYSIDSLSSPKIQKLYYPNKNSTSGFIAPLHKLWELNIISNPSLKSIRDELNWQIEETQVNEEVYYGVSTSDEISIGFTGVEPKKDSKCEVLLRFSLLPQDLLVISSDLKPYENEIKKFIKENFLKTGVFAESSARITDLVEIKQEHLISYQALAMMVNRIDRTKEKKSWSLEFAGYKKNLKLKDWVDVFKNTDSFLKYVVSILGSLSSILGIVFIFRRRKKTMPNSKS